MNEKHLNETSNSFLLCGVDLHFSVIAKKGLQRGCKEEKDAILSELYYQFPFFIN